MEVATVSQEANSLSCPSGLYTFQYENEAKFHLMCKTSLVPRPLPVFSVVRLIRVLWQLANALSHYQYFNVEKVGGDSTEHGDEATQLVV